MVAAGALLFPGAACRAPEHAVPAPQPPVAVGGATPSQQRGTLPATRPEPKGAKAGCTHDEECAVTWMEEGGCCDKCSQRAVRFVDLQAIQTRCAEDQKRCPAPACAPPRLHARAACRDGNCVVVYERND